MRRQLSSILIATSRSIRRSLTISGFRGCLVGVVLIAGIGVGSARAEAPRAISVILHQATGNSVTLAWNQNPVEDNVTQYVTGRTEVPQGTTVCPTDGAGDTLVTVEPPTATLFTLEGLTAGRTYCIRMYARNTNGISNPSNTVGPRATAAPPDTTAPSAPASLTATAASMSQVNLAWPAATDNVAVATYRINRDTLPLITVPATQTTYSDVGLKPATSYTYTVQAADEAGNRSLESPSAIVTTLGDTSAPSQPTNLVGTTTTTSATFTWEPSSDNVGIVHYGIRRGAQLLTNTNATTFTDSGLAPGTAYAYSVTAVDAAANTSPAATVTLTTLATQAPCTTNGKPYAITIQVLSWTSPIARGGEGEVRYRLTNDFPITRLEVLLGTQVVDEIVGTELRGVRSQVVRVPNTPGTYNLFLRARDNAGCVTTTTVIRPLVVP